MSLDILNEMVKNKFILILMQENEYFDKLEGMIKSVENTKTNICYVCLSKPYEQVIDDLRDKDIDTKNFFFVDVLSSHYREPEPAKNCIFVSSPTELAGISVAIKRAVKERKCSTILFDTISTLLIYQETHSILKFTHSLMIDSNSEDVKKLFIVLKGNAVPDKENQRLVKDLSMLADKTLDLD